jgi:hypothetical protein
VAHFGNECLDEIYVSTYVSISLQVGMDIGIIKMENDQYLFEKADP